VAVRCTIQNQNQVGRQLLCDKSNERSTLIRDKTHKRASAWNSKQAPNANSLSRSRKQRTSKRRQNKTGGNIRQRKSTQLTGKLRHALHPVERVRVAHEQRPRNAA
jgi:hypothetical protein